MQLDARANAILEALNAYFERSKSSQGPTLDQHSVHEILTALDPQGALASGLSADRWGEFTQTYLGFANHLHDPRYMGHQCAVTNFGTFASANLDLVINNPMAIYEMGPAASALEVFVINWMLGKIGWTPMPVPPSTAEPGTYAGGVLTHGGSLAQLTALLAARAKAAPEAWDEGVSDDLVLLVPEETHYSAKRAGAILGLGARNILALPADQESRVNPEALPQFVETVIQQGKRIMAVMGNAGCTAAGLYDPLDEIGAYCNEAGLWFHVDGAHGGSALMVDRLHPLVKGLQRADSLIWDGHKMLRAPSLCAAVLVKDHRTLDQAFTQDASYLFHEKDNPGIDFIGRTIECTKAGLGLRIFASLASDGEAAIADYIDSRTQLAEDTARLIEADPDFELAIMPETNIVCFALKGVDDQLALRNQLTNEGDYYITTTNYLGRRWLRFALMNPDTTLDHIKAVLDRIRAMAA